MGLLKIILSAMGEYAADKDKKMDDGDYGEILILMIWLAWWMYFVCCSQ